MIIDLNLSTRAFYLNLILQADPHVGDSACQIRAIILLNFYHTIYHLPRFNSLNQFQKNKIAEFIENSIFLTTLGEPKQLEPKMNPILMNLTNDQFQKLKTNPTLQDTLEKITESNYQNYLFSKEECLALKHLISQHKSLSKINAEIDFFMLDMKQEQVILMNDYLKKNNQNEINRINEMKALLQIKRQYLTNQGFRYLQDFSSDMLFDVNYQKYLQNPHYLHSFFKIGQDQILSSIMPNYLSTSIMLYKLKEDRHLLNLRLNISSESIESPYPALVQYRHDGHLFRIVEEIYDEASLIINMDIKLQKECSLLVEDCFKEKDISTFLEKFKTIPIEKLILLCSAAHAPVPTNTKKANPDTLAIDFPNQDLIDDKKLADIDIDLNHCLQANFNDLNGLAKAYGLMQDSKTPSNAIVNIKHVSFGLAHQSLTPHEKYLSTLINYQG